MPEKTVSCLSNLKGMTVRDISITTAGLPDKQHDSSHNMGFLLWICTEQGNYVIYSNPQNLFFPQLVVSREGDYQNEEGYLEEKVGIKDALDCSWHSDKIVSINIVRDAIFITTDSILTELKVDVGIKLKFNEDEILIMNRDSSLGIMEYWLGKSMDWSNDNNNLLQTYMYDPDELQKVHRVEWEI